MTPALGSTPPTGPGAAQGRRRQPAARRVDRACRGDGTRRRPRRQGRARPGHPHRAGPGRRRRARPAARPGADAPGPHRDGPDEGLTAGSMSVIEAAPAVRLVWRGASAGWPVHRPAEATGATYRRADGDLDRYDADLDASADPVDPSADRRRRHERAAARPARQDRRPPPVHRRPAAARAAVRPRGPAALARAPRWSSVDETAVGDGVRVVRDGSFLGVVGADEAEVDARRSTRCAPRRPGTERDTLPDEGDLAAFLRGAPASQRGRRRRRPGTAGRPARSLRCALQPAVPRARLDRAELRRRPLGARRHASRCGAPARASTGCATRSRRPLELDAARRRRRARGERRLLRPQRRRRRRLRRRPAGARRARPAGAGAVEPARRADLGAVRLGHGRRRSSAQLDATAGSPRGRYDVWSQGHTAPARATPACPACSRPPTSSEPQPAPPGGRPAAGGRRRHHAQRRPALRRRPPPGHRAPRARRAVRSSALRALGAHLNVFAIESLRRRARRRRRRGSARLPARAPLRRAGADGADDRGRARPAGARRCPRASAGASASPATRARGAYCAVVAEVEAESRRPGPTADRRRRRRPGDQPRRRAQPDRGRCRAGDQLDARRSGSASTGAGSPATTGRATRSCGSPRRPRSTYTSSTARPAVGRRRRGGPGTHRGRDRERRRRRRSAYASATCP